MNILKYLFVLIAPVCLLTNTLSAMEKTEGATPPALYEELPSQGNGKAAWFRTASFDAIEKVIANLAEEGIPSKNIVLVFDIDDTVITPKLPGHNTDLLEDGANATVIEAAARKLYMTPAAVSQLLQIQKTKMGSDLYSLRYVEKKQKYLLQELSSKHAIFFLTSCGNSKHGENFFLEREIEFRNIFDIPTFHYTAGHQTKREKLQEVISTYNAKANALDCGMVAKAVIFVDNHIKHVNDVKDGDYTSLVDLKKLVAIHYINVQKELFEDSFFEHSIIELKQPKTKYSVSIIDSNKRPDDLSKYLEIEIEIPSQTVETSPCVHTFLEWAILDKYVSAVGSLEKKNEIVSITKILEIRTNRKVLIHKSYRFSKESSNQLEAYISHAPLQQ